MFCFFASGCRCFPFASAKLGIIFYSCKYFLSFFDGRLFFLCFVGDFGVFSAGFGDDWGIICYYIGMVDYPDRVRRVNASRGDGRGYRGFNALWDGARADARAARSYACGVRADYMCGLGAGADARAVRPYWCGLGRTPSVPAFVGVLRTMLYLFF